MERTERVVGHRVVRAVRRRRRSIGGVGRRAVAGKVKSDDSMSCAQGWRLGLRVRREKEGLEDLRGRGVAVDQEDGREWHRLARRRVQAQRSGRRIDRYAGRDTEVARRRRNLDPCEEIGRCCLLPGGIHIHGGAVYTLAAMEAITVAAAAGSFLLISSHLCC